MPVISGRRHPNAELVPELAISPAAGRARSAIVVGYGRVGKVVSAALRKHHVPYVATDRDPETVIADRHAGHEVYFGDATDPRFLEACGIDDAAGVVITINARQAIDEIVEHVRSIHPDLPIIARARDAEHARHLYRIGATEAVPETIEASFQLSQSALVGLGVDAALATASIQAMRVEFRRSLEPPAKEAAQ
jgi:CPA2 family monovalent cation:H+ antiporter-2